MLLTELLEIKGFGGVELLGRKDKHGINQGTKPWSIHQPQPSHSSTAVESVCH